ncbi:hypothetical protein BH23CHL4_BH23CHL4_16000 [soil metagenome]
MEVAMSEQTTPANAGDEQVAAANTPLSEADNGITDTGTAASDPPDVPLESESELAEDQEAIVDNAEISDSTTSFIAEAWAPDDAVPPESDEPALDGGELIAGAVGAQEFSGEGASASVVGGAGAAEIPKAEADPITEEQDGSGISECAAGFIAGAWTPDDVAPPESGEPASDGNQAAAKAEGVDQSSGEVPGLPGDGAANTHDTARAMIDPPTGEQDDAATSEAAAAFIAEAWEPDDGAPSETGEPALETSETVAENEETEATLSEADDPAPDNEDVEAGIRDAFIEPVTENAVEPVSDSDEPAFDGGELVAEAQEPDAEPAEATETPSDSVAAPAESAGDAPPGESAADDVPAADEQETIAEAAPEEPAAAAPAGAVLAADAIAASAIASNELLEQEQAAEAAPVVVERELAWGFVDTEGRIHQQTTEHFRFRPIGKIIGSGDLQIAEFESNFGPLAKEVEILEAEVVAAKNKVAVMGRVRKMKSSAGRAEALGDFEELFARLHALEATIQTEIDERRASKEALIVRAEEIKDSTEWKVTGEAYKELFQEWRQVGATGREADDSLWARFIGARELFNTRRGEHFNQRQEQWEGNRLLKQDVIVRAHELSTSDQWRPTSDALRALFDEWKKVGSAGRQSDEELWQQFRGAQQHFYDRRNAAYDENRQRKDQLCQRAEELRESTDWNATVEEMKAMMADWKTIGTSGKRDVDDALWNRFRGAQNAFFDKRYAEASAREQEERSQSHRKEEIASAIEQLAYSTDAVAASEQALELRGQFEGLPSIRRDREEQLERRIRKAMGDIRVNAAAEGARRSVSWQGKLREALVRSKDQIESLNQTVVNQETALEELRAKLESAGEDGKAELEQQIQELYESLSYNQAEIERLKGSMSDISDNVQVQGG